MSVEMLEDPVSKFTNPHLIVVASEITISDAVKTMIEDNVDSILVFENEEVIGIVTNKNILASVVAKGLDPSKITVKEITQKPLIKIHKDTRVREAISLMNKNDIRRLIVIDDKRTIGTISQKKLVGNLNKFAVALPELEIPDNVKCPYCASQFDDKDLLSNHIDNLHIGID